MGWHRAFRLRVRPPGQRRCLPARRRWPRLLLEIALFLGIGWLAMAWNPFGLSGHTEAATRNLIYQAIAPLYESKGHEAITVVLLDDEAMPRLATLGDPPAFIANDWPARYADHATVLQTLLRYRPRAIFMDMYFLRERVGDATAGQLYSLLELARLQGHTEIYIGRGFADQPLTPMQERLAEHAQLVPIFWRGSSESYPLIVGDGEPATYFGAHALYRDLCVEPPEAWHACEGVPLDAEPPSREATPGLSVIWGSRSGPDELPAWPWAGRSDAARSCVEAPQTPWEQVLHLVRFVYHGFRGAPVETAATHCPYHRTLTADRLIALHWMAQGRNPDLEPALTGQVIFYGGSFAGMADLVPSPVHGQLPGVYLHAMALDNLLRLGSGYVRDSQYGQLTSAAVWALFVVPMVAFMRWHPPPVVGFGEEQATHWLRRLRRHVSFFLVAAVILIVITLAAFGLTRYEPANFVELFGIFLMTRLLLRDSLIDALGRRWKRWRRRWRGQDAWPAVSANPEQPGGSSS